MKRRARTFGLALAVLLVGTNAGATLTSSEKAQVRDFVAGARVENAARVRALVARTDLSQEESIAALSEAVAPVAFAPSRAAFLREFAFGPSSAPSRPLLVHAVTRSLLARADALLQRHGASLEREPQAIAELFAIYAFLDGAIANAGRPSFLAHDASAGISSAAYDDCSKALREHVERNARWLKGSAAIAEAVAPMRAEAQVALVDMLPDGLTRRVDAADRLAIAGARRKMLVDWGILFTDAGKLDDAKVERARQALARLGSARADLSVIYAGEERRALGARGRVSFVGGPTTAIADPSPFGEEVEAAAVDPALSAMVQDLAVLAVKRMLEDRTELRVRAERDVLAALAAEGHSRRMLGRPAAPSVEHVVGAAVHLLLLDAPRAIDLAFARALAGRPESAALLVDALGVLVALAAETAAAGASDKEASSGGVELELGKGEGFAVLRGIRLGPAGDVRAFSLDGHAFAIERAGGAGAVTGITRDGQPVALAHLPTAKPLSGMPKAPTGGKPPPRAR